MPVPMTAMRIVRRYSARPAAERLCQLLSNASRCMRQPPVQIGTVRARTSRISQVVTLVAVVVPPLGLLSAMGLLWGTAFHWVDLVLLVGSTWSARSGRRSASTATSRTRASRP